MEIFVTVQNLTKYYTEKNEALCIQLSNTVFFKALNSLNLLSMTGFGPLCSSNALCSRFLENETDYIRLQDLIGPKHTVKMGIFSTHYPHEHKTATKQSQTNFFDYGHKLRICLEG